MLIVRRNDWEQHRSATKTSDFNSNIVYFHCRSLTFKVIFVKFSEDGVGTHLKYDHIYFVNAPLFSFKSLVLSPAHQHHHTDVHLNPQCVFRLKMHSQYVIIKPEGGYDGMNAIKKAKQRREAFCQLKCFSSFLTVVSALQRNSLKVKEALWPHYTTCVYWFEFIKAAA